MIFDFDAALMALAVIAAIIIGSSLLFALVMFGEEHPVIAWIVFIFVAAISVGFLHPHIN